MKALITIVAMLFTSSLFAHSTIELTRASDTNVESMRQAANQLATQLDKKYDHMGGGTVFNAYKITQSNPAKKSSESNTEYAERILKSLLHRDYPITGDDGGYDLGDIHLNSMAQVESYLNKNMDWIYDADYVSNQTWSNFKTALLKTASNSNLIVLDGSGSGNNTMANIFAVIDLRNNELVYIIDSNFGSDD